MSKRTIVIVSILAAILVIGAIIGFLAYFKAGNSPADLSTIKNHLSMESYQSKLLRLKENGDVYYVANDGKRYVFVSKEVVTSWFGAGEVSIAEQTIKQMEKSPLGGQMSVRPGTIITTESDPNRYIAIGGKIIKKISTDQINELYGTSSGEYTIPLANYFFTAYTISGNYSNADNSQIIKNQSLESNLITH